MIPLSTERMREWRGRWREERVKGRGERRAKGREVEGRWASIFLFYRFLPTDLILEERIE